MEPERREDGWSRERITEVLRASIKDRQHLNRHLRWVEWAVVAQGVALIVSMLLITGIPGGVYTGLIGANSDRATESKRVADRLAGIVDQIQAERKANIEKNCRDLNARNVATVRELDARLAAARSQLSPAERAQLKESRDFTVALIDALAPRRDCDDVLASQIPSAEEPDASP